MSIQGCRVALSALTRVVGVSVPAFQILLLNALVLSQVVLSLALPVPMIGLVVFTSRRNLMGAFANGWWTRAAAITGAGVVLALNVVLLAQAFGVPVPGLGE